MEQLREKVAREIVLMLGGDPDQKIPDGSCAKVWEANLDRADRILDIPKIRDALAEQRLNAMSPAQFGEKLLGEDVPNSDGVVVKSYRAGRSVER